MKLYIDQAIVKVITDKDGNKKISIENSELNLNIFQNLSPVDNSEPSFGGTNFKIYQLGIQSLPGLKFTINDNMTSANANIVLGQTGIFELNLADATPVTTVTFTNLLDHLSLSDTNYCIIDVIYSYRGESSES